MSANTQRETQLTIILTLKDRSEFTYRWMRYMNDCRCPYLILIADGGADKEVQKHLENKENYPNLRYEYIRYPVDNSLEMYYLKLQSIISKANSEYILFADNDDFIVVNNIKNCIDFLNDNKDFVSCGGRLINLYLFENNALTNKSKGDRYIARYIKLDKSIINDLSVDRIRYFFQNADQFGLWNCWYQIHRRSNMVESFKILESINFKELVVFEIAVHLSLLKSGKYKDIGMNLTFRQEGTSQSSAELDSQGNLVFRWIMNNSFNELSLATNHIFPNITLDERKVIGEGVAEWISSRAKALYPNLKGLNERIRNFLSHFIDTAEKMNYRILLMLLKLMRRKTVYLQNDKLDYFLVKMKHYEYKLKK